MELVAQILDIYANYGYDTEVIAASLRHSDHVRKSALMGVHIATVPFAVLEQCFKHPLTDTGLQKFLEDWERARKS